MKAKVTNLGTGKLAVLLTNGKWADVLPGEERDLDVAAIKNGEPRVVKRIHYRLEDPSESIKCTGR